MTSKQLDSILNKVPPATIAEEKKHVEIAGNTKYDEKYEPKIKKIEETERIVAVVPKALKQEIKEYLQSHKGETERIIILKALKLLGFNISSEWLVDKRSMR